MRIALTTAAGNNLARLSGPHGKRFERGTRLARKTAPTALAAIVAVAVLARVPYLTTRSIWYDEASSWQTASFPVVELPRRLRLNVHLPLYYLVLKGWITLFGDSVAALRGLSVASGATTVAAVYLLSREAYLASSLARSGTVGKSRKSTPRLKHACIRWAPL
jgi:uncharacterized membrane protein